MFITELQYYVTIILHGPYTKQKKSERLYMYGVCTHFYSLNTVNQVLLFIGQYKFAKKIIVF